MSNNEEWQDFDVDFDAAEEAALPYAVCRAAGLRVIPLQPIIELSGHALACGCGDPECKALGKHPTMPNWQTAPDWDDGQIEGMRLVGQLDPAYGVLIRDGLMVVDVDQRNGGHESIIRLERDLGADIRGAAGFVVRTGSGGESAHYYFRLAAGADRMMQNLAEYPGIDFKSSGFVVGYGSPHVSGRDYELLRGTPGAICEPPPQLVSKLRETGHYTGVVGGVLRDVGSDELAAIAKSVPVDKLTYEEWVEMGMALHHTTGGSADGLALWDTVSAERDGARYKAGACAKRWRDFGKSKTGGMVTLGTLIMLAKRGGYSEGVTFESDIDWGDVEVTASPPEAPTAAQTAQDEPTHTPGGNRVLREILIKAKDSIRPWDMPGVSGQLYNWLESQSRYPRRTICAGAVLYALSCLGGMRHQDARDNMGLNVMVFAVAGTGTGKEAIFQAVAELFQRTGISQAMHGKVKSEQEIYRNLLRHQGAFYSVDEMGIMLKKITQASQGSGAAYYIAVIGAIMEIYSKSQGILTITGDLKEEIKDGLKAELAKLNKLKDKGEKPEIIDPQIAKLNQTMLDADSGMRDPFLSMLGMTTPETFDTTVNTENVKNGFIARALILRETENNPRWKDHFYPQAIPDHLAMRLGVLYWGGHTKDGKVSRVERQGEERQAIVTKPDASEMLDEIRDVFWEMGEQHKHSSGMEGVTRRSWEMCSKISLLLAMADGGVRTVDHVLYGFAMAYADTNAKITLARAKDDEEGATAVERSTAKHLKILSMLSRDDAIPAWKIVKALKMDKATAQPYLDALVAAGKIIIKTEKPVSGKERITVTLA